MSHQKSPGRNFVPEIIPEEGSLQTEVDVSQPLEDQQWYWPDCDKEEVNEFMRDKADGHFLVRDSTVPGQYTLTLRMDSSNKLIRIFGDGGGGFGFSLSDQPMPFTSVPALIEFYRRHSLKDYNPRLDIMLLFPLNRSLRFDSSLLPDLPKVCADLERFQLEYLRTSQRYDLCYNEFNDTCQDAQIKKQAIIAFQETIKMFTNQKELLNRLEPETVGNEVLQVQDNLELIEGRCTSLGEHKASLEDEVKKVTAKQRKLEMELNEVKPKLLWLYKKRNTCQSQLLKRGMHQNAVQKIINDAANKFETTEENSPRRDASASTQSSQHLSRQVFAIENWLITDRNFTKQLAVELVRGKKDGTFLIRPSSLSGFYALTIVCGGAPHHCLIENIQAEPPKKGGYGFANTELHFETLEKFVAFYSTNSLEEHNPGLNVCLSDPVYSISSQENE